MWEGRTEKGGGRAHWRWAAHRGSSGGASRNRRWKSNQPASRPHQSCPKTTHKGTLQPRVHVHASTPRQQHAGPTLRHPTGALSPQGLCRVRRGRNTHFPTVVRRSAVELWSPAADEAVDATITSAVSTGGGRTSGRAVDAYSLLAAEGDVVVVPKLSWCLTRMWWKGVVAGSGRSSRLTFGRWLPGSRAVRLGCRRK